ncbi:glycoside hydrolase family 88 protein [Carboxylicivirga mesophila]|uniref:Glycoside hydrolase family 88 protein n=1 Tax=Carboxylicivirga mesophila TaxID=1166478 RepID=A0ABS5KAZ8_9BACT|nr:glycoside hydrolase family 88 protein [Carboxylicivirga mesophila]MBS2212203.1 glycoside hydrolase family 88 protein [Carboxylicivirga mesophila]
MKKTKNQRLDMLNLGAVGFLLTLLLLINACTSPKQKFTEDNLAFAQMQLNAALNAMKEDSVVGKFPRSVKKDGSIAYVGPYDWTSGFFPGSLWYLYELNGDAHWQQEAILTTEWLDKIQYYTGNHDVGFMINCSYGNALRLTGNTAYQQVLINAAESLSTRFSPVTGVIKSWGGGKTRDGHVWQYPVIIDNMMNLELLFKASELSGNNKYRNIAIQHANTTINNHFREDYSSYHVLDYDTITGEVRGRYTHQGYSHESSWARGQAWGLYGFTITHRATGDESYLKQAEHIADYIINHPNLPDDRVPSWDYHVKDAAYAPSWVAEMPQQEEPSRDASAAAITCSALFELSQVSDKGDVYYAFAKELLHNLSDHYRSVDNPYFILEHSVGYMAANSEVDVPLNYADYYFLEALIRYKHLNN